MIRAKFAAGNEGVEVTVSAFEGAVGGLLSNVNRWRGQVGLPPLTEPDLPAATSREPLPAGQSTWVEMSGTDARTGSPSRLIGVVIPHGAHTWFFKLMGPEKPALDQKPAFREFLKSVNYSK